MIDWIKLKDRRPLEGKEVLVTDGKVIMTAYLEFEGRETLDWVMLWPDGEARSMNCNDKIIAWAELPQSMILLG